MNTEMNHEVYLERAREKLREAEHLRLVHEFEQRKEGFLPRLRRAFRR